MVSYKKCRYVNCKITTRKLVKDVFFIPFPKPKRCLEKCKRWIDNCGLINVGIGLHEIKRNTYICSIHFVGGHGPTETHPDPVPIFPVITADSIFVANTELPRTKSNDTSCEIINDFIVNIDGPVELDSDQIEHNSRNSEISLLPESNLFKDPVNVKMEVDSSILEENSVSFRDPFDIKSEVNSSILEETSLSKDPFDIKKEVDSSNLEENSVSFRDPFDIKSEVDSSILEENSVSKDPFDIKMEVDSTNLEDNSVSFRDPFDIKSEVNSSILKETSISSHSSNPTTSNNLEEAGSSSVKGSELYTQAAELNFKSLENKIHQTPSKRKTFVTINTSPFKVQDMSVANLNHLYVNFMEYRICNMEEELPWIVSRNGGSLSFYKENTKHIGSLEVKVDANFEMDINVYSKILRETHQLLHQIPTAISKLSDLLVFLKAVDKFKLCEGNQNPNKFFQKLNLGYINGFFNSVFSYKCEQLYTSESCQSTVSMCRSCSRFAYNMNKRIKRKTYAAAKKKCLINLKRNLLKNKRKH